jgi:hypothetical protein
MSNEFNRTRRNRRYPIFGKAEITTKHEPDPAVVTARVDSISEYGLGIYSTETFKEGTEISLNIDFLNFEGKKERDFIEGMIGWVKTEGNYFHAGIIFDEELNADKHPNLYRHFHRIIKGR